ncbi:MAG TPA: hypothetical protein PL045_11180, partial [Chitinophagaceae bacterium]|nr:hypothetical protein [Chitinophagaceae bacterium]
YKENGNYIILRKRMQAQPSATLAVNTYIIKGSVKDRNTGLGVQDATVYEKTKLAVALTANDGSFTLKLKTKSAMPLLNISKENYYDTSISVLLPANKNIVVSIQNKYAALADEGTITIISPTDTIPITIADSTIALTRTASLSIDTTKIVERTVLGKFLLSAKLKIQSVNLSSFYTTKVYQISFTPGLSTHGRLSPQVENLISLNALGGYTGGTRAFEAGGLFNINRRGAQYMQAAGLLNIVGGNFNGLQAAGLHNHVLGDVHALQAAGISNYANYNMYGMQAAGIYNHVRDSAKGFQAAGIANYTGKKFTGVQAAGIGNITTQTMNGVQVAGIFNYAKKLNGLQIGLVNVSDSSNGYSIGLVNIVKHGLHQISFSANEITSTNIELKTGNKKLYSILHAGYNFSNSSKVFSYGYGIGTSLKLSPSLSFQPELMTRYLYTGDWKFSNILSSLRMNVQAKLTKNISLYAAPVLNVYASNQTTAVTGYKFPLPPSGFPSVSFNDKVSGWLGFSAGIVLF